MRLFRKRRNSCGEVPKYPYFIASLDLLPQDLLAEICQSLGPQELYNLSRTSKSIRTFLTSRSNAGFIWRQAFQEAVAEHSLPPCPYTECELRWAHLLFGRFCHVNLAHFLAVIFI
ncbi:hypothetical protein B0H19DRAFT_440006 [Mycena capillaripes]|nr:hypothetical protein B0H19DRAFT_440006 [Mycena capillaripes]